MPYSEAQQRAGQRAMIEEGFFSRTMDSVTGGVVLAGFALALGATDLEIGLLAAIPMLAQLAQVPAVALLRRFPDHRALVVWGAVGARTLLFAIAAIPFLAARHPVGMLLAVYLGYATLATISGAGWQLWVRALVPRDQLGRYFGRRMAILAVVGLVASLAAGAFVSFKHGERSLPAYALLFAIGGAFGYGSAVVLSRAPSAADEPPAQRRSLAASLREPLTDANYRGLLRFLAAWGFAANLAVPFVSVILLRTLGYSILTVTLFATLSQLANLAGLRLWAPLTDRYGNRPVLGLAASVFMVAIATWALVPKHPGALVLVAAGALHALLGFANAGLDVASNGIVLKLAREDEAPSYLASAAIVKALAAGVAPLVGGLVVTLLGSRELRVLLAWGPAGGDGGAVTALRFASHDFLFLASFALGLYALHRLLGFREEGEAGPDVVLRAMRREVGQPTSIAGMRTFAHVASYVVEAAYRFETTIIPRRGGPPSPPER